MVVDGSSAARRETKKKKKNIMMVIFCLDFSSVKVLLLLLLLPLFSSAVSAFKTDAVCRKKRRFLKDWMRRRIMSKVEECKMV